jgi:GNAT superfamily N-acetyltransferase
MQHKAKAFEPIAEPVAIRDEFTLLPAGRIAAVITHLEMRVRPALRPEPASHGLELHHASRPDLAWYRALYRLVGEEWLWFSRLALDDAGLAAIVHSHGIEVYSLRRDGHDAGMLELDFRRLPDVEISFLGVVRPLLGTGAGRFLMNRALERAWSRNPRRVTVHTCTLDHPNALAFYLRTGFVPYARSLEVADDPRLIGLLPRTAAPHVPIMQSGDGYSNLPR